MSQGLSEMRIGVNALFLIPGGVGGTETYLRGLLDGLAEIDHRNEYFVFTNRETGPDLVPKQANFTMLPQPVRATVRPLRILWEQTGLAWAARRLRLDVMLNPGFTAPLLLHCPQVTVFHDMQHKRHPEYFRWFDLPFWRFFLFWSARVSKLVLAISSATARDVLRYYRLPEDRVRVTPLGVEQAFFEVALRRKPERFVLTASTLHPHKNLDGLMRAFAEFRRMRPEFRLVVCGLHGFAKEPLHELRESLGLREAVDFPGWLPRQEVHELFARAWAFIYPSLFEGFGLPVLEAMAAGVPMAYSAIDPLTQIAGDAGLPFDPRDVRAIANALERVVDDGELRARLAKAGPERAAAFSWAQTAHKTLQALENASGLPCRLSSRR